MDKSVMQSLIDYRTIIQSVPDLYLILNPRFEILEVSDAYLKATKVSREAILGRNIFDVFPPHPNDESATGPKNLRASLENVLQSKVPDAMAVQRYDIRLPDSQDEFEERYWSPINTPVMGENNEVNYIIHRVEDVTEFVHPKKNAVANDKLEELRTRAGQMEAEIIQRAQEIQKANQHVLVQKLIQLA